MGLGPCCFLAVDAEVGNARLQLLGLRSELFGRCGHLFGRARILLRDLVQLLDRLVDLPRTNVLFATCRTDLGDERIAGMSGGPRVGPPEEPRRPPLVATFEAEQYKPSVALVHVT